MAGLTRSSAPAIISRMSDGDTPAIQTLIVDNDASHAQSVAESLEAAGGYQCTIATSGAEGVRRIEQDHYDLIVTDLKMSDVDGLGILKRAKEALPDSEVVLVTGHGSIATAVQAIQQGAFNYLQKPLDLKELRAVAQKASEGIRLRRANLELERRLDEKFGFEGIVGSSAAMHRVIDMLARIAPTDVRVLITGETGTGKELVAKAIHQNSPRKKKPFLALNCASFVENILDVELFGSVPGVYTDARDRAGKFEFANGGTLFLDEVGDMPLATQSKLLRVLETGEITRIGANESIKVNVRVLSATNQNLKELISQGRFREDVYQRLRVVEVHLPALRERSQDIPLLADHFLRAFAKRHDKPIKGMTTAARRKLLAYTWPGNVRELANVVEHMVVVDGDGMLDVDDLPQEWADAKPSGGAPAEATPVGGLDALVGKSLEDVERLFIAETLKLTGGNREEAARLLGIGERTLYRKIDKFGL
jgi:two-component system response regulator HydG